MVPEFAPAVKVRYQAKKKVGYGVEYYTALGALNSFQPLQKQNHLFFLTGDLPEGGAFDLNFGIGREIQQNGGWVIKMIFGKDFHHHSAQ